VTSLFSVAGKVAFVTGASSGLGAHFARTLAQHGARVALAARRVDRLTALENEIKSKGGQAMSVALDVTDAGGVAKAFAAAEAALGPVNILVNNAGISGLARFTDASEESWREVMAVNFDGVFRVGQEAARRMSAHGQGGSIINIASIIAFATMKQLSAYGASKAAVVSLTKSMALELAGAKVRVNAIAPGYFSTEINESLWATDAGKAMIKKIPQRRLGNYPDLDGPLLLLASDAGAFMTGSVITVDGGHLLASV
jgi:3-oxoacyl-[acyl-carrier protein] reductase